jgi:hypothetical protein
VVTAGSAACATAVRAYAQLDLDEAGPYFAFPLAYAVLAGLLLGVPAVSRELERGTAVFPWTLAGSRRWWLAGRASVLLALLLVALVPVAIAADHLEMARAPYASPSASFVDEASRGLSLVAVGVAALAVGTVVGAILGRQLPALIVAGAVMGIALTGVTLAMDRWATAVAEVRPLDAGRYGDRSIAAVYQSREDSRLLSLTEVIALQPPRPDLSPGDLDDAWIQEHFTEVLLLVPRERFQESTALRTALWLVVAASLACGGLCLVERRRV